ncbi:unnamed protein product [Zymoseptoria tritici ST99CH_3D7]|uniref:Transglycosylase SLT domain-containing protein n=1 Tax=Zymoseptoria tritici (strain ST99CH_3D7) TaxID=1276538 RepID=A0A1X7S8R9_ZYMT9|nr:unnamed protein product [Zymoseptoria tritici ST99CH_3D7]
MAVGRGTIIKKSLALCLFAGIVAMTVALCITFVPKAMKMHCNECTTAKVLNKDAYKHGGASNHPTKMNKGSEGKDEYNYYSGTYEDGGWPKKQDWISFENMWNNNIDKMKSSCGAHHFGDNLSDVEIEHIQTAIQRVAKTSKVDNRFIFALIMQESKGCVRVHNTNNGVRNPGIMQSHNGHEYDPEHSEKSIEQMVVDGTQGTSSGEGLVQGLDKTGNAYAAARFYNSGQIAKDGDLSDGAGATACYASDVANRLTGWVDAKSKCPGEEDTGGGSGEDEQSGDQQDGQQDEQQNDEQDGQQNDQLDGQQQDQKGEQNHNPQSGTSGGGNQYGGGSGGSSNGGGGGGQKFRRRRRGDHFHRHF